MEAAAEAGYLPKDSSVPQFLDAIEREVRGEPVYAQGGENPQAVETATLLDEMNTYLQAIGVANQTTMLRGETEEVQHRLRRAMAARGLTMNTAALGYSWIWVLTRR